MKKHYRAENDCLNCGTILVGKFCHVCGQENLEIKEGFGHMMNHAVSDYFHFDHQFFHTLKPLMFKPGMLTNEYMAGRRTQFLHPVKMYIFISLIYFLLVFKVNNNIIKVEPKGLTTEQISSLKKTGSYNEKLTPQQAKKQKQVFTEAGDTSYQQYSLRQKKLSADKRDGFFKRYFVAKEFAIQDPKLNKKELLTEGINHNIPKMMFLLLPLFALILKVTFWRSKKFYVEHLIYSLHLHCFIFLFFSIVILLQLAIPDNLDAVSITLNVLAGMVVLWYVYKSLRAVYHRGPFRTITKMIGMSLIYSAAFAVALTLLVLITFLTVV